ncbi:hypothetical protein [uncultured Chitinophaga sp.]|uniref:hypothetical protein n=1 Tax=uncultured Chitinophaga sp. TaxID=339340 RepID=UPI0025F57926|nr:hypothetical protein [uncultured Chitinophaga sp.]
MRYTYFAAGLLLIAASFVSCKKDKSDFSYDNRPVTDVQGNSLLRIVNLAGHSQMIANGDTLTSFAIILPNQEVRYPSTYYFPETGRLGTTWNIPRSILRSGKATLQTETAVYQQVPDKYKFDVEEKNNAPMDYYLLQSDMWTIGTLPAVLPVPRSVTAPAKAGYFKIRLLNLADELKPQSDDMENVSGPLTLTYADGTPVSPATSNITLGLASDYIEVPYGVYQFKVLTPAGIQVTGGGGSAQENTHMIDPATSTLVKGVSGRPHTVSTHLTYAPVRTYQPGGVYTIVVGVDRFTTPYYNGQPGETTSGMQNAFRVMTDVSEPENVNYTRLQAVHALPGSGKVQVRVNGRPLAELAYSGHSEYGIYVSGQSKIEALDDKGSVIASHDALLSAGQNYTAWVYTAPDGKPAISLVSNNLSGGYYFPGAQNPDDGTYTRIQLKYPFQFRFMNFCADLPYVSFTTDNGQPFTGTTSARNLQPGKPLLDLPYVSYGQEREPYQIMAFRSSPAVYPGTWLSEIATLNSTDMIARRELYVRGELPNHEPGVYTIALVGQLKGGQPEAQKAKMIIVKHTK